MKENAAAVLAVAAAWPPPTKRFQIPTPPNVNYFQIWSGRRSELRERKWGAMQQTQAIPICHFSTRVRFAAGGETEQNVDRRKGAHILLSNSYGKRGTSAKQEQENISHEHVSSTRMQDATLAEIETHDAPKRKDRYCWVIKGRREITCQGLRELSSCALA